MRAWHSFSCNQNKGIFVDGRKVKQLTNKEWDSISNDTRKGEFLRIPWDILKSDSGLISDYVRASSDLSKFAVLKAFMLLQHQFYFIGDKKGTLDILDELEYQELRIENFKLFEFPWRVKYTKLVVNIQNSYKTDTRSCFIKLPYTAYDKARSKLAILIEAIVFTYNIESVTMLWRVIVSKYGTSEFKKCNVLRYVRNEHPRILMYEKPKWWYASDDLEKGAWLASVDRAWRIYCEEEEDSEDSA